MPVPAEAGRNVSTLPRRHHKFCGRFLCLVGLDMGPSAPRKVDSSWSKDALVAPILNYETIPRHLESNAKGDLPSVMCGSVWGLSTLTVGD